MRRLLITGGSGYLGRALVEKARDGWDVLYTYCDRPVEMQGTRGSRLDILDEARVNDLFRRFRPHTVIHAAYSEENLSVIVQGTKHVAAASFGVGARLLHMSTDAVFDGERGWYREQDIPAPIHPYGQAKLESELFVTGAVPVSVEGCDGSGPGPAASWHGERNTVVVRTSLIWGLLPMDPRTLRIKECLEKSARTVLFTDEFRCPIFVEDLAAAVLEVVDLDFCGVIHIAGPERMNRYDFGARLAGRLLLDASLLVPGSSRESGLTRPRDCSLDTSFARDLLRTPILPPSVLLGRPL